MSDTGEGPGDKVRTSGGGEETQPEEEAVSDTGEGPTTEGLGTKVRTPWEKGGGRVWNWRGADSQGVIGQGMYTRGRELSPRRRLCLTLGRGWLPRGRGTRYVHPGKGGYLAQEEAISDTGEGPTTEGPGNKVRTPDVGEGGVGGEGAQACRGEGTKEHGRKYKS